MSQEQDPVLKPEDRVPRHWRRSLEDKIFLSTAHLRWFLCGMIPYGLGLALTAWSVIMIKVGPDVFLSAYTVTRSEPGFAAEAACSAGFILLFFSSFVVCGALVPEKIRQGAFRWLAAVTLLMAGLIGPIWIVQLRFWMMWALVAAGILAAIASIIALVRLKDDDALVSVFE